MKLLNLPLSSQHTLPVCLIALIAIVAFICEQLLGYSFTHTFVYQQQLIHQGQWWRLFTGHFLHTNGYHLLLNLAALFMLWLLHGRFYHYANYSLLFLATALLTSLGIYYFSPSIQQYVGLSGVLHGIFVFGAIKDIGAKDKTGYLLLLGVFLKVAHEQIYGASTDISSLIAAKVAVDAHLWGALSGLLFSLGYWLYWRKL